MQRLVGAVAAARAGDAGDAAALLEDASAIADRLGGDRNDAWLTFGPANTGVHRRSFSVKLSGLVTLVRVKPQPAASPRGT